jgi:hypothetical protein
VILRRRLPRIFAAAVLFAGVSLARADAPMADLDAWQAAKLMGTGVNIGNTLDNTTQWETGWGNPRITREYVQNLAALGFRDGASAGGVGYLCS